MLYLPALHTHSATIQLHLQSFSVHPNALHLYSYSITTVGSTTTTTVSSKVKGETSFTAPFDTSSASSRSLNQMLESLEYLGGRAVRMWQGRHIKLLWSASTIMLLTDTLAWSWQKVATQTAPRKWDVLLEDAISKSPTSGPRTSAGRQSQGITGYEYTQGQ